MELLKCLLCIMVLVRYTICAPIPNTKTYHGFIFDVGSTGTRLNIFAVYVDSERPVAVSNLGKEHPVEFIDRIDCKIPFGVQTDLTTAKTTIDGCLESAMKELNSTVKQNHIWLKFVGTGGLRTLRNANRNKFDELMGGMENYFRTKQFLNPSQMKYVEILDDNMEAQLGYVSSIYKEGTKVVEDKGVVDVGGSSLQVVFPISKQSAIPPFLSKKVVFVFNSELNYGVLNFECGGVDNIKRYYLIGLFKSLADKAQPIQSPCHPIGFTQTITTTKFNDFCTQSLIGDMDLPATIIINGSSNKETCEQKLLEAFCANSNAQHDSKCILKDDSKAPISVSDNIKINLMGAWVHFARDLKTQDYTNLLTEINKMFTKNECFIGKFERCFVASYVTFITKFFIKPADQVEIKSKSSGWTLGKMLVDSKNIILDTISSASTKITVISVCSTLVVVILLVALFAYYQLKKP